MELWKEVQASAGSVDDCEVKTIWIGGGIAGNVFEYESLGRFLNPRAMDVTQMLLAGQKQDRSFDIIAGLPGQTEISLKESLQTVLDSGACHISLYPYEEKAGTALTKEWEKNGEKLQQNLRRHLPDARELAGLLAMSGDLLTQHGMTEYLPGRWALPGKECAYHVAEAAGVECLAFGLGAESCLDGIRSWNTSDLSCYLQNSPDPFKIICRMEHFPG